jgi:hypothetical protein
MQKEILYNLHSGADFGLQLGTCPGSAHLFFFVWKKKEMLKKKTLKEKKKRVRSESHLSLSRPTLTRRRQPARRPKLYRPTVTFLTRVSLLFLSFSLPALSSLSFSLSLG